MLCMHLNIKGGNHCFSQLEQKAFQLPVPLSCGMMKANCNLLYCPTFLRIAFWSTKISYFVWLMFLWRDPWEAKKGACSKLAAVSETLGFLMSFLLDQIWFLHFEQESVFTGVDLCRTIKFFSDGYRLQQFFKSFRSSVLLILHIFHHRFPILSVLALSKDKISDRR